jgi:DNA-nicking Smr family endonuclease
MKDDDTPITPEDADLWELVADTTKPMPGKQVQKPRQRIIPKETKHVQNEWVASSNAEPLYHVQKPLNMGDLTAMDKNTATRFRKGQLPIDGKIDLHGSSQEVAFNSFSQFIFRSYKLEKRCLLVVTGKGARSESGIGVLRQNLPHWINDSALRSMVLAISYAQPKHGGEGAIYVLLKRQRGED